MRNTAFRVCLYTCLVFTLAGCASAAKRSQDLLAQGDYVGAIETLAQRLADKPNDKDAIPVFTSVYPSHPEKLITSAALLRDSAGTSTTDAVKLVSTTEELVRIQRAVRAMPDRIGDDKKLGWTVVKKYDFDFEGQLGEAKTTAAGAFYDEAGKTFPGSNKTEKEALVKLYSSALQYVPDYKDSRDRGAQLCFEIADELEDSETITDLESAVEWFKASQTWVANYRDSGARIQSLSYDIGTLLKAEGTVPSYDKAYTYFKLAGNFKNAQAEVQVYDFYKTVMSLSNESKSGSGNHLKTTSSSSGTSVKVEEQPRSKENPFEKRAIVKAESSAFSIFNPRSDVVFIGSIIDGTSVADETFKPILASRAPLDITIDLANIKGDATVRIDDPAKYSNAQQAIKRLVNQGTTDTIPVRAEYRYVDVKSSEMLSLALGVGVGKGDISIHSQTNYDTSRTRSSTLVELTQIYYTVNIDIPSKAADFFATSGQNIVSPSLLDSTTPYYVSSVSYGRRGYFLIESDETSQSIQQQIELAKEGMEANPLSTSFSIDTSVKNTWTNSKTTITAHVLGGSGKNANITSLEGMMQWIKDGMDASRNLGTAVPVGFVMRSLKDNGIAVVEQAGTVTMPAKAQITVTARAFQIDRANNPKTLIRMYLSGGAEMKPENASKDPDIRNDGKGWHVAYNNGDNALGVGDGQKGVLLALESRPYTAVVASGDDRFYIGANLGDRMEQTVFGKSIGKNEWAGFKSTNLTVNDIINQTQIYQDLVYNGWEFRGPDFSGKFFFQFDVELYDE